MYSKLKPPVKEETSETNIATNSNGNSFMKIALIRKTVNSLLIKFHSIQTGVFTNLLVPKILQ